MNQQTQTFSVPCACIFSSNPQSSSKSPNSKQTLPTISVLVVKINTFSWWNWTVIEFYVPCWTSNKLTFFHRLSLSTWIKESFNHHGSVCFLESVFPSIQILKYSICILTVYILKWTNRTNWKQAIRPAATPKPAPIIQNNPIKV